ncbi:uncharacterized protein LOC112094558, partial [Morus notabilis]|uniref:uncharacterized protein LOC112094558 n=1 Tax=Morus notabilis TaxID=981085 RepID=UPI000CED789B
CSWEDHMEHLDRVMSVLRANHLVAANSSKIQAMLDWPSPRTIKELWGFLGLTGYYRRFGAGVGGIAGALTHQLKKDAFAWNSEAEEAFQCLKKAITEIPVLDLPDFSQPFVVESNASGFEVGAVLIQQQRPIAYFSQVLLARARTKSACSCQIGL